MSRTLILATATLAFLAADAAPAQKFVRPRKPTVEEPKVKAGRTAMAAPAEPEVVLPTTTIVQALPTVPEHATLQRLLAAAQVDAALAGPGPFTVFAPTDEAFSRLPPGALDTLLKPENRPALARVLNYHVVAGRLTAEDIKGQIANGGGTATFTTVAGEPLTATADAAGTITLTDVNGGKAYVTGGDLAQANGVIHVTNGVVFPKFG